MGVAVASLEDIAATKLLAVNRRPAKDRLSKEANKYQLSMFKK